MGRRNNRRPSAISPHRSLDALLVPVRPSPAVTFSSRVPADLSPIEDRRTFWPEPAALRPALTLRGTGARVVGAAPVRKPGPPGRKSTALASVKTGSVLTFSAPKRVAVCVRRQRRKEVLFATGKGGRRGRQRQRRRSEFSEVSCR